MGKRKTQRPPLAAETFTVRFTRTELVALVGLLKGGGSGGSGYLGDHLRNPELPPFERLEGALADGPDEMALEGIGGGWWGTGRGARL